MDVNYFFMKSQLMNNCCQICKCWIVGLVSPSTTVVKIRKTNFSRLKFLVTEKSLLEATG